MESIEKNKMNRKSLRIAFSDFIFNCHGNDRLSSFNPQDNFFTKLLGKIYNLKVVSMDQAEVLIYSAFGNNHRKFHGKKIFYTSENILPDFDECDYAISFCHLPGEPRHYRLPQYVFYVDEVKKLIKAKDADPQLLLKSKTKFANFIVSNPRGPERNLFFKKLNRRKSVDSGGRHFNNLGKLVSDKQKFLEDYKFTIAFENSSSPGYTTEKIVEAMLAGSVPIYWGNSDIQKDFNPKSFIDVSKFSNFDRAIEYILKVDNNKELYISYLREPYFNDNIVPTWFNPEEQLAALQSFVDTPWIVKPRMYKNRGLRDHVRGTGIIRHFSSFGCRLEGLLWRLGCR